MTPTPLPEEVDLVIYHASCMDGTMAAWAAWSRVGDRAEYHAAHYNTDPPDVTGKNVAIVDFSYSHDVLVNEIMPKCRSLVILDHHKTAQKNLEGIPNAVFDMNKSGAVLSWEFFHPTLPAPEMLQYVQDRDLWRWEMPSSRQFNAVFSLHIQSDFKKLSELVEDMNWGTERQGLFNQGDAILRYQREFIVERAKKRSALAKLNTKNGFVDIVAVNSATLQSEIGSDLAREYPDRIAMVWYHHAEYSKVLVSLRSVGGVDCSEVAEGFGGGGHRNAAGFQLDNLNELDRVVCIE